MLLTQRPILQPRAELEFAAQDVPELAPAPGFLRLRYEITRQFAPYVGVAWTRDVGRTAEFTRADGEDPFGLSVVAGLRLWF